MSKKDIALFSISILIAVIVSIIVIPKLTDRLDYQEKYSSKVAAIMADDIEIERKWLIDPNNIPYDLKNAEKLEIEQTYINFSPEIRVRRLNNGMGYTFAVKTQLTENGMARNEIEEDITKEEYEEMITKKSGNTIYKTRYQFLDGDYLIAIDIFHNDLDGLAYMEIEFENHTIANSYQTPDWVIKEVTNDINYKNGYLARYGIPD